MFKKVRKNYNFIYFIKNDIFLYFKNDDIVFYCMYVSYDIRNNSQEDLSKDCNDNKLNAYTSYHNI